MIGVSSSYKNEPSIKVKIQNMKRRERSTSRDSSRYRRKRNRSSYGRYDDSSEEGASPDRVRRHERLRSPVSPYTRYAYEKSHREEYASRDAEKAHSYKVLCVSALHPKASDEMIKDVLYKEYKKYGDLTVRLSHDLDERVAYVYFRSAEDARDAKHAKSRVVIYDKVALVEPVYESRSQVDRHAYRSRQRSRSYSPELDRFYRRSPAPLPDPYRPADRFYDRIPYPLPIIRDFRRELPPVPHPDFLPRPPLHPALPVPPHLPPGPPHLYVPPRPFLPFKPPHTHFLEKVEKKDKFPNYLHHVPPEDDPLATRTLFAGNLELSITEEELRRIFGRYGVVEDVDIKRPLPGTGNAYAFVRYKNLDMAHRAKVELSGQYIGKFQCKIGYGKATPTTRIWVGGLGPWTSKAKLESEFDRFGAIKKIDYDKTENSAYILYDSIDAATAAVKEMRGFPLGGVEHKLRVDFADIGSRQPRPPPPSSSSSAYADVASSAGDYHASVSGSGRADPSYDAYEPWPSSGNDFDYEDGSRGGIPPGVTLWSDRKNDKDLGSGGSRRGDSPNNHDSREYDDGLQQHHHRYKRTRSNSDSDSEHRFNGALATARSLADITRCTTNAWQGALILKSSLFPAKFHITDGDGNIINVLMKSDESKHLLKISQRLRLDPTKVEDVSKRIALSTGYGIFVGLPGPSSSIFFDETTAQCRPLRNLITYLKQKEAAGVITLFNKDTEASGVLYAFPPCKFSAELLKRTAHAMTPEALKEDHLMIVVVKGGAV